MVTLNQPASPLRRCDRPVVSVITYDPVGHIATTPTTLIVHSSHRHLVEINASEMDDSKLVPQLESTRVLLSPSSKSLTHAKSQVALRKQPTRGLSHSKSIPNMPSFSPQKIARIVRATQVRRVDGKPSFVRTSSQMHLDPKCLRQIYLWRAGVRISCSREVRESGSRQF